MLRRKFLSILPVNTAICFFYLTSPKNKSYGKSTTFNFYELAGLIEPALSGEHFCLRKEALDAFSEMSNEARKSGLRLWATSGYRSFEYQKNLWNAKYKTLKKTGLSDKIIISEITRFTSLPGASRHHWGTDLDITDALGYETENPLNKENFAPGGEYQFLKYWLVENAFKFGFYEVYTDDPSRTGFSYEPWHYSYGPLSKPMLKEFLEFDLTTLTELNKCKGHSIFNRKFLQKYVNEYVLGINPVLLN